MYWQVKVDDYLPGQNITGEVGGLSIKREYFNTLGKNISYQNVQLEDSVKIKLSIVNRENRNYVKITDFLPTGFSVDQTKNDAKTLATINNSGDQVKIIEQVLALGTWTFEYWAQALSRGEFTTPAPRVDLIYLPDNYSVNWPNTVKVK